jgi:hypothetical protein
MCEATSRVAAVSLVAFVRVDLVTSCTTFELSGAMHKRDV